MHTKPRTKKKAEKKSRPEKKPKDTVAIETKPSENW